MMVPVSGDAAGCSHRVIPAGPLGKLKTVVQGVAIAVALVPLAPWLGDGWRLTAAGFVAVAGILTVWSGIDYLVRAGRAPEGGAARD
jgi:CDP-diacylglycerol--glycerol-3-phosphate 3-phosphatidyltransferase